MGRDVSRECQDGGNAQQVRAGSVVPAALLGEVRKARPIASDACNNRLGDAARLVPAMRLALRSDPDVQLKGTGWACRKEHWSTALVRSWCSGTRVKSAPGLTSDTGTRVVALYAAPSRIERAAMDTVCTRDDRPSEFHSYGQRSWRSDTQRSGLSSGSLFAVDVERGSSRLDGRRATCGAALLFGARRSSCFENRLLTAGGRSAS